MSDPKIIDWKARAEKAQVERDALSAHVERLFNKWDELTEEGTTHDELTEAMDEIFGSAATISLARRDLIKQAEALEEEANEWPADKYTECSHVRESILDSAAQLRRQSEADE